MTEKSFQLISKRDQWFDELEKLEIADPWTEKVSDKFQTDEWYKKEE